VFDICALSKQRHLDGFGCVSGVLPSAPLYRGNRVAHQTNTGSIVEELEYAIALIAEAFVAWVHTHILKAVALQALEVFVVLKRPVWTSVRSVHEDVNVAHVPIIRPQQR